MTMKFGYARVSKGDQNLENQVKKLEEANCDEIFQEKVSGAKDDRPELDKLMNKLRKGDTVCVVRFDRLGRRMIKLVELIKEFQSRGVEFVSLQDNVDTTTPIGMLLFNICAAFSEMERELIKERVLAGLEIAKSNGKIGGRPTVLTKAKQEMIEALKSSDKLSVTQICKTVDIGRTTYYNYIKTCIS